MKSVCYVLAYRSPNYIRTRTLVSALKKNRAINLYLAINTSKGIKRYFETLWKLINIRFKNNPDYYILGFRGYELFWAVRIVTLGKTLIFDHMMSPYDSLINERKTVNKRSFMEKLIFFYEKNILASADIILTDTEIHKNFFQELFTINEKKIVAIPVGADEVLFHEFQRTPELGTSSKFEVLFYGTFLPLHGIDIILSAALKIAHLPIHFTLIGGDQDNQYVKLIKQYPAKNISHINWVEFEKIPELISSADIGLGGPFGNTGQAHRVITGKTMQFLAMRKLVIIGKIPSEYGFKDKLNCLIVSQGNADELADAISWAFAHKGIIGQIGTHGFYLYQERFSIQQISKKLEGIFNQ